MLDSQHIIKDFNIYFFLKRLSIFAGLKENNFNEQGLSNYFDFCHYVLYSRQGAKWSKK